MALGKIGSVIPESYCRNYLHVAFFKLLPPLEQMLCHANVLPILYIVMVLIVKKKSNYFII